MAIYANALNEGIFKINTNSLGLSKELITKIGETLTRILITNEVNCNLIEASSSPCNTLFKYEILNYNRIKPKLKKVEQDLPYLLQAEATVKPLLYGAGFIVSVPNSIRETIPVGNLLYSPKFQAIKTDASFVLGIDEDNEVVVLRFGEDVSHMIIAGETGSGKSTCLNLLISSIMANAMINTVKFILVDPKRVELAQFKNCTHFLHQPIITAPYKAIRMLWDMCAEMEKRYKTFERYSVKNIEEFNKLKQQKNEVMPRLIIVIDEFGDLMTNGNKKETEPRLIRLAQTGRACGIHLVLATQRPSATIVSGDLKANLSTKISFAVATGVNSRVILDKTGAEKLLGKGDGLYTSTSIKDPKRFQGGYVSDKEIEDLIQYIQTKALVE